MLMGKVVTLNTDDEVSQSTRKHLLSPLMLMGKVVTLITCEEVSQSKKETFTISSDADGQGGHTHHL